MSRGTQVFWRILVVGLGGGSLPMFLRKHYPPAGIDVAEIDPDVVDVAKKYFGFREDERMHAYIGDGRQFIENVRQGYDIIFLDAFGARDVPKHLTTLEFLQITRRALKPNGVVVSNIWRPASNPLYDSMVRTHQEVFEELLILDVPGDVNNIFLALARGGPPAQNELALLARKISTEKQFRFDLLHRPMLRRSVGALSDHDVHRPGERFGIAKDWRVVPSNISREEE